MKKFLSIALSFIMVLSMLAQNVMVANAADFYDEDEIVSSEDTDTVEIQDDDQVNPVERDEVEVREVTLNESNFPDPNLRYFLKSKFNIYEGQLITKDMIEETTSLDISDKYIEELTGLRNFVYLYNLDCSDNPLLELDLSNMPFLGSVDCSNCGLVSLNVGRLGNLYKLDCSNNKLEYVDVTLNTRLVDLNVSNNVSLSTLNLVRNTELTKLKCDDNKLIRIDVSKNEKLQELSIANNKIEELDLNSNTKLLSLNCSQNFIKQINISGAANIMVGTVSSPAFFKVGNQKENGAIKVLVTAAQKTRYETSYASDENNARVTVEVHQHSVNPEKWVTDSSKHWHECEGCGAKSDIAVHVPGPAPTYVDDQVCTVCKYVIEKKLDTCTHPNIQSINGVAPGCTTMGYRSYYHCPTCGVYLDGKDKTPITVDIETWKKGAGSLPAGQHLWDRAVIEKEQTYTETGIKTYKCLNCGATKSEDIPVYGSVSNNAIDIAKGAKLELAPLVRNEIKGTDKEGKSLDKYVIVSGKKYGTVSKSGIVKTKKAGTMIISVREKVGKKKYEEVYKITVNVRKATLSKSFKVQLAAKSVNMANNIAFLPDNQKVKWSIAPKYQGRATIDANTGEITLKSTGKIVVTCYIGKDGYAAKRTCTIKIK